jgi:hypothetical protein
MLRKAGFCLVVFVLIAGSLQAQSVFGEIEGAVSDDKGDLLAGVTVEISSPDLLGVRSEVTGTDGEFRFPLLPAGTYKVVIACEGYQTIVQQSIRLPLEATITLKATMTSTYVDEVDVIADTPLIDISSTAIGTDFSPQQMEVLPTGREFNGLTFLASGAVEGGGMATPELKGNPSIMGSSVLENRYIIDQIDTTDVFAGYSGASVPYSFIGELQVKTGGYEAEYGGALGGVINMITKSGGNEHHGEAYVFFTNDSLWASPKIPATRGESRTIDQEYDVGFNLGGKLLEDTLWYFVGFNPSRLQQWTFNNMYQGNALYQSNQIKTEYEKDFYLGKLTWQIGDSSSMAASVIGDPTDVKNDFRFSNFIDSPHVPETNMLYDRERGGINLGISYTNILSEDVFLEATLGRHEGQDKILPHLYAMNYWDLTAAGEWSEGVSGNPWFGGTDLQRHKDDRTRDQLRFSFTWYLGDHELKLGGGYHQVTYDLNYTVAGEPTDPFCMPSNGAVFGWDDRVGDYVSFPDDCSVGGGGGVMSTARVGNQIRLLDGYYYSMIFTNISTGETDEYNLFVQDSWQVTDTLTLQLGLRAESSESVGNATRLSPNTKLDFGFGDMVAPRLGFIWDFLGNGKSKIYGHYGKFFQSIPLDINVRAFGNELIDLYFYYYPGDGGLPTLDNLGTLFYIYKLSSEGTVVDPDIEPQYLEEFVFGGEVEVKDNLVAGVKYVKRDLGKVIEDISLDDGLSFFVTNPGGTFTVNPGTGAPLEEPIDFPEAKRTYNAVELSLHKRMANSWQLHTSLLWSQLKGNHEGLYSRTNRQIDPNITASFDLASLLVNAYGLLPNDREWQLKSYGSYAFDFGLVAGANLYYLTGAPLSKLGGHWYWGPDHRYVTPRGSEGRTPDWYGLDLHLDYPIHINDMELKLILDVFNVANHQSVVEADNRWTVFTSFDANPDVRTNDSWSEALLYSNPRNIRFGLKLSW